MWWYSVIPSKDNTREIYGSFDRSEAERAAIDNGPRACVAIIDDDTGLTIDIIEPGHFQKEEPPRRRYFVSASTGDRPEHAKDFSDGWYEIHYTDESEAESERAVSILVESGRIIRATRYDMNGSPITAYCYRGGA